MSLERMKKNLDTVEKLLKHRDQDWIHVNIGQEGSGKSTLALRMAEYFDKNFSVDNIVFTPQGFINRSKEVDKYSAIVVDEGANVFYSRDAMKKEVKSAIKFLTQMRELNLFIIINIPNFFIIDKYLREHRTKSMSRAVKPGWFHFFSKKKIGKIRRKSGKIDYPDPTFRESWKKMSGELWDNYIDKKHRVIKGEDEETEKDRGEMLSPQRFGDKVGLSGNTIVKYFNEGKIDGVKLKNGHLRIPEEEKEKIIEKSTLN